MNFYKWAGKLLVRSEFLSDDEKKRGVTKKFAVSEACCCAQWYCVLTSSGDYECRDKRPDPTENAQVLSEHKTEKDCQKECYERYYCIDESGDYKCVKESDLPENATIISGPQRQEECEAKCENCPPCGNEACESEAKGDDAIIEECCFNLEDEEEWTFNGTDWELTQRCGNDERTPCKGKPVPSFPQGLNPGDVFTLSCIPDGRKPEDNKDCEKCLYDCDKTTTPYTCVYTPDDGKYTEKECDTECAGRWYCKSHNECEKQNPPKNPAKNGYDTESECLDAAIVDCCAPDCSTPPDICGGGQSLLVNCSNFDCAAHNFDGCLDGLSDAMQEQGYESAKEDTEDCCQCDSSIQRTIAGCCPGGVDFDESKSITIPRKEDGSCVWCGSIGEGCIADTENGAPVWRIYKCNPPTPPCGDCVPIPGVTNLQLEVRGEPGKEEVCVLATAQWTPPDGCYASDQEARDKVSIVFEFLDKDREVIQSIGGPANIGENIVGYCSSLVPACDPSSKKAEFARAKAVSDECESEWSREFGLPGGSASWEDICKPPQPDGYICQGPFSQIWECAPCNECAGQPEVYATMEECQAACKPPDPRCLPPAICTWSPPDCGSECWLDAVWDDSDPLPPAYCASRPYDCTSKSACEAWVQANPNPPCEGRQEDNPLP